MDSLGPEASGIFIRLRMQLQDHALEDVALGATISLTYRLFTMAYQKISSHNEISLPLFCPLYHQNPWFSA